jgi:putative spermidine/putrescine transport system ATP-binding protein
MVVMNRGTIEQVGAPREVFNRPATEFVARFMGGHNVIDTPAGKVGVRCDHMQISPADGAVNGTAPADGLAAVVTDVQYQGTYVLLGLQGPGGEPAPGSNAELSVMLPEAGFAERPYAVGERVQLAWPPGAAHPLH